MKHTENLEEWLKKLEAQAASIRDDAVRREGEEKPADAPALVNTVTRFVEAAHLDMLRKIDSPLTLLRGRYVVNFDIIVGPQGTLTIEQGTELFFTCKGGVISYGALKAIGTAQERIKFTAVDDNWQNITIAGGLASDSILKECIIEKGHGRHSIKKEHAFSNYEIDPYYLPESSKYEETGGGGLLIVRSSPTIERCVISNNSATLGGGAYLDEYRGVFVSNEIRFNKAHIFQRGIWGGGGGLYLKSSNPKCMKDNLIAHNEVYYDPFSDEKFCGGGIFAHFSHFDRKNNTVRNNDPDNIDIGFK